MFTLSIAMIMATICFVIMQIRGCTNDSNNAVILLAEKGIKSSADGVGKIVLEKEEKK